MAEQLVELGQVPFGDAVLNEEDKIYAYKLVSSIPYPPGSHRVIKLTEDAYYAVEHKMYNKGDILISDGSKWTKLETPTLDTSLKHPVSDIFRMKVGRDVQIRWKDPESTEGKWNWKHTVLLRKYRSFPTSIYDGVVAVDSYVKDQYAEVPFHDYLPEGTESDWHYKLFTVDDDDLVYSDSDCEFDPIEVNWGNISEVIQSGLAPYVFDIGDRIILENVDTESPWYNAVDKGTAFIVAGFDKATLKDSSLSHSITLVSDRVCINSIPYDSTTGSGDYRYELTKDTVKLSSSKIYYRRVSGVYVIDQEKNIGDTLEENTFFERIAIDEERRQSGVNKWYASYIRNNWLIADTDNSCPRIAFATAGDTTGKFLDAVVMVKNINALPGLDGYGKEISEDLFFFLSITEVTGENNGSIQEGNALPYFTEDSSHLKRPSTSATGNIWFLRSADIETSAQVQCVNGLEDTPTIESFDAKDPRGIVIACVIA